jgi:opacity protein-like surface antigen
MRTDTGRGLLLMSVAVGAVAAAAWSTPAAATDPYWTLFGGLNRVEGMRLNSDDWPYSDYQRILNFNAGGVVGVAVGKALMGPVRGEAEFSYRFNGLNTVTVQGEGVHSGSGNAGVFAMMLNGWVDLGQAGDLTPYIGGGIGAAHVHLSALSTECCSWPLDFDERHWAPAVQLGAGLKYGLGNGSTVSLDYRYFATGQFTIDSLRGASESASTRYRAHSVMLGWTMPLGMR